MYGIHVWNFYGSFLVGLMFGKLLEYFLWYGLLVWIPVGTLVYVRDSSYLGIIFHLEAIFDFVEAIGTI